jgi:hypothetical protein
MNDRWVAEAACAGQDLDLFYTETAANPHRALAFCQGCPVKPECLQEALADPYIGGVWGGTTGKARDEVRAGRLTLGHALGQGARMAALAKETA